MFDFMPGRRRLARRQRLAPTIKNMIYLSLYCYVIAANNMAAQPEGGGAYPVNLNYITS
jgi:hypothetical protein